MKVEWKLGEPIAGKAYWYAYHNGSFYATAQDNVLPDGHIVDHDLIFQVANHQFLTHADHDNFIFSMQKLFPDLDHHAVTAALDDSTTADSENEQSPAKAALIKAINENIHHDSFQQPYVPVQYISEELEHARSEADAKELVEAIDLNVDTIYDQPGVLLQYIAEEMNYARGGRLKSALNRDRKYTSEEEWEKNYKRAGRRKFYRTMEDGGDPGQTIQDDDFEDFIDEYDKGGIVSINRIHQIKESNAYAFSANFKDTEITGVVEIEKKNTPTESSQEVEFEFELGDQELNQNEIQEFKDSIIEQINAGRFKEMKDGGDVGINVLTKKKLEAIKAYAQSNIPDLYDRVYELQLAFGDNYAKMKKYVAEALDQFHVPQSNFVIQSKFEQGGDVNYGSLINVSEFQFVGMAPDIVSARSAKQNIHDQYGDAFRVIITREPESGEESNPEKDSFSIWKTPANPIKEQVYKDGGEVFDDGIQSSLKKGDKFIVGINYQTPSGKAGSTSIVVEIDDPENFMDEEDVIDHAESIFKEKHKGYKIVGGGIVQVNDSSDEDGTYQDGGEMFGGDVDLYDDILASYGYDKAKAQEHIISQLTSALQTVIDDERSRDEESRNFENNTIQEFEAAINQASSPDISNEVKLKTLLDWIHYVVSIEFSRDEESRNLDYETLAEFETLIEIAATSINSDKYAAGGRLKSALNRDRKYTSEEEWEKNYNRAGRRKFYRTMEDGGDLIGTWSESIQGIVENFARTGSREYYDQIRECAKQADRVATALGAYKNVGRKFTIERDGKKIQAIDITPTWEGIFTIPLTLYTQNHGSKRKNAAELRKKAIDQLKQMAEVADREGKFLFGGRLKSALNRDRKYTSNEEWEKNYKRAGRRKFYRTMENGGMLESINEEIRSVNNRLKALEGINTEEAYRQSEILHKQKASLEALLLHHKDDPKLEIRSVGRVYYSGGGDLSPIKEAVDFKFSEGDSVKILQVQPKGKLSKEDAVILERLAAEQPDGTFYPFYYVRIGNLTGKVLYAQDELIERHGNKPKLAEGGDIRSRCPEGTEIQTLILSKDKFSKEQAKKWAVEHGFTSRLSTIDETANNWRLRQSSPSRFEKNSFRTITLKDGEVQAVIACPKNK